MHGPTVRHFDGRFSPVRQVLFLSVVAQLNNFVLPKKVLKTEPSNLIRNYEQCYRLIFIRQMASR